MVLLVVTPQTVFGVLVSAQALIVCLFGGVGTLWGPVIGASILVPLAEVLHGELGDIVPGIQGVVYGLAIIVIILSAPEGIFWRQRDRFKAGRPARAGVAMAPGVAAAPAMTPAMTQVAAVARPPGDRPPLLEIGGVSRSFGGLRAVDNVSITVEAGSIHGIIGPTGAGKSTLFRAISGTVTPVAEALESRDLGYVLETGRVVMRGAHDVLMADERVKKAYLGL
ncbi:MAG: ATP-binding cassette domain-containing protein [Alphaproteobacteria bacterium]|nr:ATP-binding cassette domain-containing protein [Alphaproteobacteria bacterium]